MKFDQRHLSSDYNPSCTDFFQQSQDNERPLSPSRLNEELNKILETEKKIREYKQMITSMQREMYSKKKDGPSGSTNKSSMVGTKKVFQEDLTPSTSIRSLIRQAEEDKRVGMESLRDNKHQVG